MKPKSAVLALAAAVATLALPSAARAQIRQNTVEISPFYGRLFGGEFARGSNSIFQERVDADDANTWGLRVGYNATESMELEVQASRTDTHFVSHDSGDVFGPGGERLGDLRVDYLLGYGTFNFGHRRAVPYVTLGAGVGRLRPSATPVAAHSTTRFTGSLGAGVKVFVTPHFGLRFDGRGYSTYLNSEDTCSHHHDNCNDTHWLTNGELSGGLILAF
ncbi:MAG TPA: outer membrane beta-barrel protein [Thermoanaerobaculia bacterium]|nr:outer membrane beta-barrel protein [Thermoanaerobaculia bacterium]